MTNKEEVSYICDTIVHELLGFEKILREFPDLDVGDIEEILLDNNYEKCPDCEWYVPSHELIPDWDDEPDGHCDNCRQIHMEE